MCRMVTEGRVIADAIERDARARKCMDSRGTFFSASIHLSVYLPPLSVIVPFVGVTDTRLGQDYSRTIIVALPPIPAHARTRSGDGGILS